MTVSIVNPTEIQGSQDQDAVLSVRGVSKKFCRDLKRSLFYGVQDITSEMTGLRKGGNKLRNKEFWALQNISFELNRGDALGLVGKNGSGKSTLLRIIAGLIKPDIGSVEVNGRVAPLIALGAGFNPILTGRENIYANMSILGLSRPEIDDRFDQVLDFAEIGDAIDAPLQSYSSGMAARLGFASAIHTDPNILLIDEVLAVGDIRFRAKCHRKLHELRQKGTAFILVSHNSQAILGTCDNSVYLSKGCLVLSGETDLVMSRYEEDLFLGGGGKNTGVMSLPPKSKEVSTGLDITALFFRDGYGNILESPITGEPAYFCVGYKSQVETENVGLNFAVKEMLGESDYTLNLSSFNDKTPLKIPSGEHEIQVHMPHLGLRPGVYTMVVAVRKDSIYTLDSVESFRFTVEGNGQPMSRCLFYQPRTWNVV